MKTSVKIKVRNYHLDSFAHVNNARYLEFLEEGRWSYCEDNGLIEIFESYKITHVTVNINIDYKRSAIIGDHLIVETSPVKKGEKSITFSQKIFLDTTEKTIAKAEVTNVFFNRNKEIMRTEELSGFWDDLKKLKLKNNSEL